MAKSFFRDSLFSTLSGVSASVADFVSGVIIARTLGASGAGSVALAVWIALVASRSLSFGLPLTLSRYLPELRARKEQDLADGLAATVLRMCGSVAVVLAGLFILASVWFTDDFEPNVMRFGPQFTATFWPAIALLAATQCLALPYLEYLSGMQRFKDLGIVGITSAILRMLSVAAGATHLGAVGAVAGYILGSSFAAALSFGPMRKQPLLGHELRARIMRFAGFGWGTSLLELFVWSRAELLFIALFWGAKAAGLYAVGMSIASAAALLPTFMTNPLLPYFGFKLGARDLHSLQSSYTLATRLIGLAILPVCFGMAAICPVVIPALYGSDFEGAVPAAMVITAGSAIGIIANPSAKLIYSVEKGSIFVISNLIGAGVLLAAGVSIIPAFGILGAAASRIVAHSLVAGIELFYVRRSINFTVPFWALLKTTFAAAASAAAAYMCVAIMKTPMALAAAVPSAAFVYLFLVRTLGILRQSDSEMLGSIVQGAPLSIRAPLMRMLTYSTARASDL
jgi:O-antigen/teichoic acid export membrane protein